MLVVGKKQIDFENLFETALEEEKKKAYNSFYGYDDYLDDDEYCSWWETYESYKTTNHQKSRAYDDDEEYNEEKLIYFYPDVTNKKIRNEYNSLFELDEFLTEKNIEIDDLVLTTLMANNVIHCTTVEINGTNYLVASNSWSSLVFKTANDIANTIDDEE